MISIEQSLKLISHIEIYARKVSNHDRHANDITYAELGESSEKISKFIKSITKEEV